MLKNVIQRSYKTAQPVKVLVTKPEDLGWDQGATWEGDSQVLVKLLFGSHDTSTHNINKCVQNLNLPHLTQSYHSFPTKYETIYDSKQLLTYTLSCLL